MADFTKYCIIIPVYNSEKQLPQLINKIRELYETIFIYIINDGSTDSTLRQIPDTKNLMIFSHYKNRGKGASLITGIQKAQQQKYQYAIFLDSDLQHDPSKIIDFIEHHEDTGAEMVLGRRDFKFKKMPFTRILSNTITSWLISIRCRKKIHDSQCGYRLIDIDNIDVNSYKYKGFQFESEFLIRALDNNIKYRELKIPTIYKEEKSSINGIFDTLKFIKLYIHSFFWK